MGPAVTHRRAASAPEACVYRTPVEVEPPAKVPTQAAAPTGALRAGFATDRWTLKRIQQLIERDFAIVYHPNYLARLLHQLGFSVQQPTDRALERDEARVEAWRQRDWPRIKKSPSA